jgi:hypothetical protein
MNSQLKTSQISRPLDLPCIQSKGFGDEITSHSEEPASYFERDEWQLKFEVNENGVGRILLPPGLTIFLQSDRVCVMPMGGGLFIKSV